MVKVSAPILEGQRFKASSSHTKDFYQMAHAAFLLDTQNLEERGRSHNHMLETIVQAWPVV